MNRGLTGRYEISNTTGEAVSAFVPNPLPPQPPLDLSGERQRLLEQALLTCGRLDGVTALLPDPDLFLYAYVRREAVLSSQIEGTQSSLSDLLLFELEEALGVPFDDVVEVSNYVRALEHGAGVFHSRRNAVVARADQGGSGARAVRDHTSLPRRQRPRRPAADRADATRGARIAAAAAVFESLLQAAPRRVLPPARHRAS